MKQTEKQLTERAECLLSALIQNYIQEGQPIGSKKLAAASKLELSSASVRNVMAELEAMGFVESPHTSAGRVPTAQGYRYYVDSLLQLEPVDSQAISELSKELQHEFNTLGIVSSVSEFLSNLTSFAGIVTLPKVARVALRQIEFLPLSDKRILTILVTNEHEVQNRIIPVHREFSAEELQRAANYLNDKFAGKELQRVRQEIMQEMNDARVSMDQMMRSAIEIASQVFEKNDKKDDFVVAGQTNLMDYSEFASMDALKQLFDAFNQKRDILSLLDKCLNADGVQIFIGSESGYLGLGECSLVTSTYSVEGRPIGTLGVIGPTRMPYEQVVSVVDVTAKVLSAALKSKS